MINLRNAITPADPTSTLLALRALHRSGPLQINGGGILTLVVSNSSIQSSAQYLINLVRGEGGDGDPENGHKGDTGPLGSTSMSVTEEGGDNNDADSTQLEQSARL